VLQKFMQKKRTVQKSIYWEGNMKFTSLAVACLLLNSVCGLWADDLPPTPIDPVFFGDPVLLTPSGAGRQLSVQVDQSVLAEHDWRYFPAFQTPPPSPDQSSILLTDKDSLVISVPVFDFGASGGLFDTTWSQSGNQIYLNGFFLYSFVEGNTICGPKEFLKHIDPLPPGIYSLHVSSFFAGDSQLRDFDAFKSNPENYIDSLQGTDSMVLPLSVSQETLQFTVVPEPSVLIFLGTALGFASLFICFKKK
jgi:hypothetical protein